MVAAVFDGLWWLLVMLASNSQLVQSELATNMSNCSENSSENSSDNSSGNMASCTDATTVTTTTNTTSTTNTSTTSTTTTNTSTTTTTTSTMTSTTSTSTTSTSTTIESAEDPRVCARLYSDCFACWDAGCRLCEVGPERSRWEIRGTGREQYANPSEHDYSCIMSKRECDTLRYTRPNTHWTEMVPRSECARFTTTVTFTTTTGPSVQEFVRVATELADLISKDDRRAGRWSGSPADWGAVQWVVVCIPLVVLCGAFTAAYAFAGTRSQRQLRRVQVQPVQNGRSGGASESDGVIHWDLSKGGTFSVSDLHKLDVSLTESEQDDTKIGPQRRLLLFGANNNLQAAQLDTLRQILGKHPRVCTSLHADWHKADEGTLQALAGLLRRRQGCVLRPPDGQGICKLKLPLRPAPSAVEALAEAIATASHVEVDELELPPHAQSKPQGKTPTLALSPLRLSVQELVLRKEPVGDLGILAATAFVRPWSGRILGIRMIECEIGDQGASAIARLLGPRYAGPVIRELCLSVNNIQDQGAAELAQALPRCDNLERLLLDRNCIGEEGAKALALQLPRSNVSELVFGSTYGGNPIGEAGAEALANALDDQLRRAAANRATRLSALNLDGCSVGELGAKALATKLPRSALMALSLARNNMGDDGAKAVIQSLPTTLNSLDLAGNALTDSAASALAEAFYRLPQLAVSLSNNRLSAGLKTILHEEHGSRLRL